MWLRSFEVIVGIYYLVFGLDGFFKKIPLPKPSPRALSFLLGIEETKYILFLVKIVEILVGVMWILGLGGGFAWILFTPIWLNIVLYQLLLNRQEVVLPLFLIVSHLLLAIKYWFYLRNIIVTAF